MQDDEPLGTVPVPNFLRLPDVAPGVYVPEDAAKLIAGRYGNAADVLDFITEQAGEGLRDIDTEGVRDLAAAYRSPARMETVTGCEALHWIAFGFLVSEVEAGAREEHLGYRWCRAPIETARTALEAVAEARPRKAAPHYEEAIQLMLQRVALDGEHPSDPRALLALYNRDMAVREWCRERLRAASRRLIHAPKGEQFVVWGTPSDGSGRREIPMKVLTAPGMIFWTTSEFRPDGEADINVYAARRKDPVWREIVVPAKAIYELRASPSSRSEQSAQFEKRPIPESKLRKHLEGIKATGGAIPAADRLFEEVVKAFPNYHVTRDDVRTVHKDVWGKRPPGRRRNSAE